MPLHYLYIPLRSSRSNRTENETIVFPCLDSTSPIVITVIIIDKGNEYIFRWNKIRLSYYPKFSPISRNFKRDKKEEKTLNECIRRRNVYDTGKEKIGYF